MHAFLHGFCQVLLVPGEQGFDLVVRLFADRVDLRTERFARQPWIPVEQRLNLVVVFLKQRSDLFPLAGGEFQVFCQMIEFLIDRPRAVDTLACLIRPLRLRFMFLGHGNPGYPDREYAG